MYNTNLILHTLITSYSAHLLYSTTNELLFSSSGYDNPIKMSDVFILVCLFKQSEIDIIDF